MRSFTVITIIALAGVFITHFQNQSRKQMKMQQKVVNSVYQHKSIAQPYGKSEITKESTLYK